MTHDWYVTDTHPLIWHLTDDSQLSPVANRIFSLADAGLVLITIPSIVIVEMIYLAEKGRISADLVTSMLAAVTTANPSYQLGTLEAEVIQAVGQIPKPSIPEMPDRIIAGTAKALDVPLITKDSQISGSGQVNVIW